jgi:type III restriction enzyme
VVPRGEVKSGFRPFRLDLSTINYPAPDEELWIRHLGTEQVDVVGLGSGSADEQVPENHVVNGLVHFDDIAYGQHSALLYDLAEQVVTHLRGYLSDEDARKVLRLHQKEIARFVHAQMQKHFWQDDTVEYEVSVKRGFTELRPSVYTAAAGEKPLDFRISPADKSNMARYLFAGFSRCLYPSQKFQSDTERKLAVILDRESLRWFKPARGQFQIYYRWGADNPEYQPDFVAEMPSRVLMLESKAANQMTGGEVLAKQAAAVRWCRLASEYLGRHGGKPWTYALLPHDAIAENMTIDALVARYGVKA